VAPAGAKIPGHSCGVLFDFDKIIDLLEGTAGSPAAIEDVSLAARWGRVQLFSKTIS
jgi:hypothetical protein